MEFHNTTSQMEKLLREYSRLADTAKTQITEIVGMLSEHKVPDRTALDNFDKSINALQGQYNSIYNAAKESLDAAEMPRAGSMAEDYAIAVLNSKPALLEKRRQIAKILLKRFLRIKSSVEGYAKELAPYQQQASEALASVDGLTELLDIEKMTTAPRFFFKALEREDVNSYDYSKLLKVLGEHYPDKVLLGITGKKYFISAEGFKTEGSKKPESPDETENENKELEELGYDPSFIINDDVLIAYEDAGQKETVVIPPWVREIGGYAFSSCRNIRRIFIPNSVQHIKYNAFSNTEIRSVVIPDSVTELEREAFDECRYLKSAVIGKGVDRLSDRTFYNCQRLVHLELPAGLRDVSYNAFEGCYSLTRVWVEGREYSLRDKEAPKPVKLVYSGLKAICDRIRSDYENGLMDEYEYVDYNIAGDGYSF